MNLATYFLLSIAIWSSTLTRPATDALLTETVRASLTNGDAPQLSAHFARTLELIIDADNVKFTSVQATHAELILRSFFRKHPPQRFQFVYQGSSEQMHYSTGTYQSDGQTFAVYVLMRQTGNQQPVISALHFRKE